MLSRRTWPSSEAMPSAWRSRESTLTLSGNTDSMSQPPSRSKRRTSSAFWPWPGRRGWRSFERNAGRFQMAGQPVSRCTSVMRSCHRWPTDHTQASGKCAWAAGFRVERNPRRRRARPSSGRTPAKRRRDAAADSGRNVWGVHTSARLCPTVMRLSGREPASGAWINERLGRQP